MKYIATISGGKDSVTMCDLLLKNNYPVDYIVFANTMDEFEEMYDYIDKVEEYFKHRYGKVITRLKPKWDYDKDYIFGYVSKGENEGRMRGIPNQGVQFCTWKRESKVYPMDRFVKQFEEHKTYIGITIGEMHRVDREDTTKLYPLIDDFRMSEMDCKIYLLDQEMENPLYKHFNRTGCKKCQYQSDNAFFKIWKHYPKVWEEMKDYEYRINRIKEDVISRNWFINYRTCEDMEKEFIVADKQGSLYDFSDEPVKDCFCKI